MNYSKKDIVTAILVMCSIITFAIIFTVFFKPLYYFDMEQLGIANDLDLPAATIKENYSILIDYQSIFYRGTLQLPDFIMSEGGRIHFEEVKRIFEWIQIIFVVSTISGGICMYQQLRKKEYRFLRLASIITIVAPLVIGGLAMMDFDTAFVLFHKLFFNNDYWVFDYYSDPVIRILPQDFFMHCFLLIIAIIGVLVGLCYFGYCKKEKQILEQ